MAKEYYAVLGVGRDATDREIRQAFRRLARQYHPDVNPGDKESEARFKEINEAYEVLSDPEKRKKYDQFGDRWRYADQFSQGHGGPRAGPFMWDMGDNPFSRGRGTRLEDLFGDFLGSQGSGHTATSSRRRTRIEQPVTVTLEEAQAGTLRTLQLSDGLEGGVRRLEVKIPAGVTDGSRIRVRPDGAGLREVFLVVTVMPHARFERRGDDLYTQVSVPLVDAVLGGEVEVLTLTATVILKIPPETQNGRSFRLSGKGMPRLGSDQVRGSLYTTVQVTMPSEISEGERELFQRLRDLQGEKG